MSVIINELEVVAAPTGPAAAPGTGAAPPVAPPPLNPPTARDIGLVLTHHLERLRRVEAS